MPPIFFATAPDAANRIEKDLGSENVRVYGKLEVVEWCSDARQQAAADNRLSGSSRPIPSLLNLSGMAVEAVNSGQILMMADIEDVKGIDALSKRTDSDITTVEVRLAALEQ